jgi:hypothetical protein
MSKIDASPSMAAASSSSSSSSAAAPQTPAPPTPPTDQKDIKVGKTWLEQYEEGRKQKAILAQKKSEAKGWTCPISLEGFQEPFLLGDGVTYEKKQIQEWYKKKPDSKVGPTGFPIVTKGMALNQTVKDHLYEDKPLNCTISMEPFTMPVVIMQTKPELDTNGLPYHENAQTYDAAGLVEALNQTWGKYSLKLARKYIYGSDPMSKDLAEQFVLVPNRILGVIHDSKMPSLPKRGNGPAFDEKKLIGFDQTGVTDKEDGTLETNGTLKRFLKDGIFTGISANRWIMSSHGKHYEFVNCRFTQCVFAHICWCQVRYTACQFVNCTFIDCDPKNGPSHTMLNNRYIHCAVVNQLDRTQRAEFRKVLIGTQTEGLAAIQNALSEIQTI